MVVEHRSLASEDKPDGCTDHEQKFMIKESPTSPNVLAAEEAWHDDGSQSRVAIDTSSAAASPSAWKPWPPSSILPSIPSGQRFALLKALLIDCCLLNFALDRLTSVRSTSRSCHQNP